MEKLLCPTDFSQTADNAIEYAAYIAQKLDATLTLLHVENEEESRSEGVGDDLVFTIENRQMLTDTMKQTCQEVEKNFGIKTDYDVLSGKLENAVVDKAGTKLYDLIIMGTKPDLFYQYFVGTNTYHVLQRVETPVLVVPANCSYRAINTIIYASNYEENDYLSLKQLKQFAEMYDAEIRVLHVSPKQSEVSREVFDSFKDRVLTEFNHDRKFKFSRIFAEDEATAIHQYVLDQDADMLGLFMQRRNFLQRLFHESVTKKLSAIAEYPILVFH